MNIWLVTTGSSDVQLTTNEHWNDWWQDIKKSLHRLPFEPARSIDDEGEPYRLPARVLGIAYDRLPDEVRPYLDFPLLKGFTQKLKDQGTAIDLIIILMSNQENIFPEAERETNRCPYWQDTCQLCPILEGYFQKHFPEAKLTPLMLEPDSLEPGLDDWDAVLGLVRRKIGSLDIEPETVYVSHQAGTPAISSAVQFASLAKFGDRVQFLVSSEYVPKITRMIASSKYLSAIRLQEAKALLDRPDYPGIQILLKSYLKDDDTRVLLSSAIQWNSAEFEKFSDQFRNDNLLEKYPELVKDIQERTKEENWWWIAYEEAYLALTRQNQDNIVEAFFHSFRAFEGIFSAWVNYEFGGNNHIEIKKGMSYLKCSVLSDPKGYFSKAKFKQNGDPNDDLAKLKCKIEKDNGVELDLATICKLFRSCRSEYKQECGELKIFWDSDKENNVCEKRNFIMHQIQGISKEKLWEFWGVSTSEEWQGRLLKFLNFIAKTDLSKEFKSLEDASLMAQVHQKLKSAIAHL
ncbi:hypothetical protein C7B65_05155 [Phormidesmis priestleyi ULC007]|uniref:CRISPR-associated protein n=1 Tax=Phormidesmis priestleyi ULC007 TaxID=1920490 RepID=A0A2T1DLE3_9CYAN|nr:hypothetical protein [Phormidesmis priestleyi]PSB21318.1 hypothetical protein C7B65_05155 [Phormidesmis priestleyi ULC007]PZO50689.1 MAG: hypothetical protein DCF14_11100 [Phormidesmis priestleyi]